MENPESKLTALQFTILDGMADDYEDLEQLYLYANREFPEEEQENIQFPRMLVQVRFPLRALIDEIGNMLREGYIKVKYSNDDRGTPFDEQGAPGVAALHHYWFGATERGTQAWKAHLAHEALEP
jgi:hypothetical protein